jgi:hypothetical protein
MSEMEPDVQDFLKRIVWSATLIIVYLLIITSAGLAGGWFFFYDKPVLGTVGMVYLLIKWWKKKFPHG